MILTPVKRPGTTLSDPDHSDEDVSAKAVQEVDPEVKNMKNKKAKTLKPEIQPMETNNIVVSDKSIVDKYTIPTSNKFEPLSHLKKPENNKEEELTPKIPPIFLLGVNNYGVIVNDIKTMASSPFTGKQFKDKIKLQLTSTDDYRKITKYFTDSEVQFYSFVNPIDSKLSVVLKPVPYSLTEEEIKNELLAMNYPVKNVTRIQNKFRQPTPACSVVLDDNKESREIFNMNKFFYCLVTVEPRYRPKGIPQCRNCLKWNHTRNYCHLSPKCVLCAGSHSLKDCNLRTMPSTSATKITPKCSNCGGPHPASYRGCEEHKKLKRLFTHRQMNKHHTNSYTTAPEPLTNAWVKPLDTKKTEAPNMESGKALNMKENKAHPRIVSDYHSNSFKSTITSPLQIEQLTLTITDIVKKTIENMIPTIIKQVLECFLPKP